MDCRTDAQRAAERTRDEREAEETAMLLNRAVLAVDRIAVPDRVGTALRALFVNAARMPRAASGDVVRLAGAIVLDAGGA